MNRRLNPIELEKFIDQTLRSLPNRRAPGTLEARVLAEIERRATVPWWHKSWSYWPSSVRALFLMVCGALAGLLILAGIYLEVGLDSAQVNGALAPVLAVGSRLLSVGRGCVDFLALVVRHIPAWWLYGAVGFVAGLYVMLFGLGAAAYRTLWARR